MGDPLSRALFAVGCMPLSGRAVPVDLPGARTLVLPDFEPRSEGDPGAPLLKHSHHAPHDLVGRRVGPLPPRVDAADGRRTRVVKSGAPPRAARLVTPVGEVSR